VGAKIRLAPATVTIYADGAVAIDPTHILAQVANGDSSVTITANSSTMDITGSTIKAITLGDGDTDVNLTADSDITITDSAGSGLWLSLTELGTVTGNMAVTLLPTGGIYLGGGIPPRILKRLARPDFLSSIADKGRFFSLCAFRGRRLLYLPTY